MMGMFRVASKDLHELVRGSRGILVLVLPLILLALVGQLRINTPTLRALAAGIGDCGIEGRSEHIGCYLNTLVSELAHIEVVEQTDEENNPLRRMREHAFDVVLNLHEGGDEGWDIFIAESEDAVKIRRTLELARRMQSVLTLLQRREEQRTRQDMLLYLDLVNALGALEFRPAFLYYPAAVTPSLALLPITVALIVCFLPFVVAAPTLIREREAHTLEVLLAAPGIGSISVFASKCLVPVAISLLEFILMLLLVENLFGLYIKAELLTLFLLITLAILSSTLLGIAVSSVALTQSQTIIGSALYFLSLLLLSGIFYPLDESSELIRWLSNLSPFTYVYPRINSWSFGAGLGSDF